MTNNNFIKQIASAAKNYYPTYKILPSMTIAQAILESNWNQSALAKDCFNYFGMKWTSTCGCNCKEYKTKEQQTDGTFTTISAKFRKYKSLADGIKGYYDLLNYSRYSNLKNVTDYHEACKLLREDGWATDISYSEKLVKLIESNNLWEYDLQTLYPNSPNKMIHKDSGFLSILWLQYHLKQCLKNTADVIPLVLDGQYGEKTKNAVLKYWDLLGWNKDKKDSGLRVGSGTRKALNKGRIK
jgi:hypothetical protein